MIRFLGSGRFIHFLCKNDFGINFVLDQFIKSGRSWDIICKFLGIKCIIQFFISVNLLIRDIKVGNVAFFEVFFINFKLLDELKPGLRQGVLIISGKRRSQSAVRSWGMIVDWSSGRKTTSWRFFLVDFIIEPCHLRINMIFPWDPRTFHIIWALRQNYSSFPTPSLSKEFIARSDKANYRHHSDNGSGNDDESRRIFANYSFCFIFIFSQSTHFSYKPNTNVNFHQLTQYS